MLNRKPSLKSLAHLHIAVRLSIGYVCFASLYICPLNMSGLSLPIGIVCHLELIPPALKTGAGTVLHRDADSCSRGKATDVANF